MALWFSSLTISNFAASGATIVALMTLIWGFWEYYRSLILSRVDHLSRVQQVWLTDEKMARIAEFLETKNPKLAEVGGADKIAFVCFLERIELLQRAKLIRPELAYNMFGHYAPLCFDSTSFWNPGPWKKRDYFQLFGDFTGRMREMEHLKKTSLNNSPGACAWVDDLGDCAKERHRSAND